MTVSQLRAAIALVAAAALSSGCSNDDGSDSSSEVGGAGGDGSGGSGAGGAESGGSAGSQAGASGGDAGALASGRDGSGGSGGSVTTQSLCEKYGGAEAIETVMKEHVLTEIATDCRVSAFFASLAPEIVTHLGDCLAMQGQELFGCEGVVYASSTSSEGLECRDMQTAHAGLLIGKGDFDAVIEDVVAGLTAAGVSEDDIAAAAPALLGMEGDIVELPEATQPTQPDCEAP